jgi:hypothetical protein
MISALRNKTNRCGPSPLSAAALARDIAQETWTHPLRRAQNREIVLQALARSVSFALELLAAKEFIVFRVTVLALLRHSVSEQKIARVHFGIARAKANCNIFINQT